jgi:hypothetical protein
MVIAGIVALAVTLAAGPHVNARAPEAQADTRAPAPPPGAPPATPPADDQAVTPPETLPISVERIRVLLARPESLSMDALAAFAQMAYFRVAVEEAFVVESVVDAMRRELAESPGVPIDPPRALPMSRTGTGGIEVLGLARSFGRVMRERSARNARGAVEDALREFCAQRDCTSVEAGARANEGVLLPTRAR